MLKEPFEFFGISKSFCSLQISLMENIIFFWGMAKDLVVFVQTLMREKGLGMGRERIELSTAS